MRSVFLALAASVILAPGTRGGDQPNFEDAPLHAIQFVDLDEGWAVGDNGAVWHTIDGGKRWERQPTAVRASLRSVHFLNPYTGWIAGREELPRGGGSAGVLLFTSDGGLKWRQVVINAMPGLERVRFLPDGIHGFVVGDGTEQQPTGIFQTSDSGRSWTALPGPRCPTWLAADFKDSKNGALGGAWNRMGFIRRGELVKADVDMLGGRSVHDLRLLGDRAVAVGQGGLVLLSEEASGTSWYLPKLNLAPELLAVLDFHAVCGVGEHLWVAGRPGSVVLHSPNAGKTWEMLPVGQSLPLHGLFFMDALHGWAVGELGSILATDDGGKSWRIQHRGGERAAALFVHARATGLPAETVAQLGGEDGYLIAALRVISPDPNSAPLTKASEPQRLNAAMRLAGGAAGEMFWQFPTPQHQGRTNKLDLLKSWDRLHADRAGEQLVRQLVLSLRIWQPDVIITDDPDEQTTGASADALVAEAVCEAFVRAADPKAFPEQLTTLGLQPCKTAKVYACWHGKTDAHLLVDANDVRPRLQGTARDFAGGSAALLGDPPPELPGQRYFRLLKDRMPGAAEHRSLMQGLSLVGGGAARRKLTDLTELSPELRKVLQARQSLQVLIDAPAALVDPGRMLTQIGPALAQLPEEQGAPAAFALANQCAQKGQWMMAREAFVLLVDRYPAHPLAAEACRWLIRHNSSSEARHRQELGQFVTEMDLQFQATKHAPTRPEGKSEDKRKTPPPEGIRVQMPVDVDAQQVKQTAWLGNEPELKQWYKGSLALEPRLAAFGRLFSGDPATQFCLQAARRNSGDIESARKWYTQFMMDHPEGPWHDAAAAEIWLVNKLGPPPKPVFLCPMLAARPYLDGKLDETCWRDVPPAVLTNAVGDTVKECPTKVWLAYDRDFVYLALRCEHPAECYVEPVKVRPRDADLRAYDRVTLLLDLDRDYTTAFHLQVDQRGCVCDDCWGDFTWDPRWFVAVHSEKTYWQIEAAIPMNELTADVPRPGQAWAYNVVRTLPGRGVQAFSVPADVQPRLEGMGLLLFGGAERK